MEHLKTTLKLTEIPQLLQSIEMLSLIVHANMAFSGVLMTQLPFYFKGGYKSLLAFISSGGN